MKKQKQRTSNLFPPYQWKTNSLHIIVKFGVKIDLFSDISLFYRNNAFIVFVQIWIFYLFISIHSSNCHLCCLLNFNVCLKCARLGSFLVVSSWGPPRTEASSAPVFPFCSKVVLGCCNYYVWLKRKVLQTVVCLSQVLMLVKTADHMIVWGTSTDAYPSPTYNVHFCPAEWGH